MEYNRDIVAGNAKREIEDMARSYPEYTQEILDMVSRYEEKYPGMWELLFPEHSYCRVT